MKRRGNKSHKVPNVKLRPAEKGAYAQPVDESCWAQDTQPEDEATYTHNKCPRPLKGFSICATGVQDKPALFKKAVELGATCTPAFTDRVTHLIADDHGGAKYMCALERKIPIVKPSWIVENYQIWLRGDDVDVEKSIEQHRLPIFSGVVVCPSGITDITRRTRISKLVTAHDGEYLKVLERPVRVTHLLCSGDEETDKMRYAEKFNTRGEAKIHLVWEEWFWDSIDFGGRFDEATYQVTRPRPERKSLPTAAAAGASGRSSSLPPTSDIPSEHDEIPSSSAGSGSGSRQARPQPQPQPQPKDLDEAEDEPAFVNVLPVVTLQLWNSLLGRRGYEISDGEVILSPSKADPTGAEKKKRPLPKHVQPPPSPVQERQFGAERSVISAFKRANSFAPAVVAGSSRQLPFRRTSTAMAALGGDKPSTSALPVAPKDTAAAATSNSGFGGGGGRAQQQQQASISSKIFAGMRFRVLGEAKCSNVRTAIDELGGVMLSADEDGDEEDVDFVIVRLVSGSKFYRDEEDGRLRLKYRTECWLEQCIYENRICPPEEQVSSIPLGISLPVPGAECVVMALSGFDQSQVCGLKRLLRALGIALSATFSKRCTHLLCPSGTGQKFDKSREWGIPVVNLDWLRAVSREGVVPQPNEFLVNGSVVLPVPGGESDIMDVNIVPRRDKGKGKAVDKGKQRDMRELGDGMDVDVNVGVDIENRMQDITNDIPSEPKQPIPHKKPIPIPIERRATTILPTPEPPEHEHEHEPGHMSFGMPSEILGGPAPAVLSRQPSAMSSGVSTPVRGGRTRGRARAQAQGEDSFAVHSDGGNDQNSDNSSNSNSNSNMRSAALQNRKTMLNLDEEQEQEQEQGDRIPSSKSPSPMKILRNQGSRSSSSLSLSSPVKIDIDHVATKALQESITSLLGKRPSPEGEGEGGEMRMGGGCAGGDAGGGGAGGGGGNGGGGGAMRNAKRTRPQRTKAQSRQSSESNIIAAPPPVLPVVRRRTRSSRLSQTPSAFGGNSFDQSYNNHNNNINANASQQQQRQQQQQLNANENENDDESQENSSIRVMYEDPVQKEEKKRLLKLLKGGDESSISSASSMMSGSGSGNGRRAGMRRNSTRVAGF